MERVYIIDTHHGYSDLLERGLTKKAFKTKERCEQIIAEMAEEKHGKPFYSENSKYVKIIKQYWAGDFSMEEAEEKIGSKEKTDVALDSALYYDFCDMFWIKEFEIVD